MITNEDVKFIRFSSFCDDRGSLIPIESQKSIPFDIERIFYVYGINGQEIRGKHSHYKTQQVLICLKGSCIVICKDGKSTKEYMLDSPEIGLFIPEMIWDEQIYRSPDTILLVLSSTKYDKSDYIEDWSLFLEEKEKEESKK